MEGHATSAVSQNHADQWRAGEAAAGADDLRKLALGASDRREVSRETNGGAGIKPGPLRPSDAAREFQFTYRFGGCEWGITIFANDPAEAREKIKAIALARYDGEVFAKIKVPLGGFLSRLFRRA